MSSTVVVVPCYNEQSRFTSDRFLEAAHADQSLSFLLVDDGSQDDTRAVLERLSRTSPQFSVLGLTPNRGKAEAVRRGLLAAFERAPAFVAYFDADLATPLSEIGPMRKLLEDDPDLCCVLGSRVALLGREIERSAYRHYFGRVFATAASLVLDLRVYDTQCGAKLFRNTDVVRTVFSTPFSTSWTFDVELLARLRSLAQEGKLADLPRSAAEYPLRQWCDVAGSKLDFRGVARSGAELAGTWLRYRRGWRR